MTHASALRNLVVTAVFRAASHADVPGWSPVHATWEPPPGGISLGARETCQEEEEEEEAGLFRADAVNEEDPERDRATQEGEGYQVLHWY